MPNETPRPTRQQRRRALGALLLLQAGGQGRTVNGRLRGAGKTSQKSQKPVKGGGYK